MNYKDLLAATAQLVAATWFQSAAAQSTGHMSWGGPYMFMTGSIMCTSITAIRASSDDLNNQQLLSLGCIKAPGPLTVKVLTTDPSYERLSVTAPDRVMVLWTRTSNIREGSSGDNSHLSGSPTIVRDTWGCQKDPGNRPPGVMDEKELSRFACRRLSSGTLLKEIRCASRLSMAIIKDSGEPLFVSDLDTNWRCSN